VARVSEQLSVASERHKSAYENSLAGRQRVLSNLMAKLDTLSPLSVLNRGYSIAEKQDGEIVRSSKQVRPGEKLKIRLSSGKLEAQVISSDDSE
jgi:exodeoxyribonuclease VII large subunit